MSVNQESRASHADLAGNDREGSQHSGIRVKWQEWKNLKEGEPKKDTGGERFRWRARACPQLRSQSAGVGLMWWRTR